MRKTTLCLLIVLTSCTDVQKFKRDGYNLIIQPDSWTSLDFNTGVLTIDAYKFRYVDTIQFSDRELDAIVNSFYKDQIYTLKGECFFSDPNPEIIQTPILSFQILLEVDGKRQARIEVHDIYHNKPESPRDQLYRVVSFRDTLEKILNKNKQYQKGQDVFGRYREKYPWMFMQI